MTRGSKTVEACDPKFQVAILTTMERGGEIHMDWLKERDCDEYKKRGTEQPGDGRMRD
jgi:hypothetical protein